MATCYMLFLMLVVVQGPKKAIFPSFFNIISALFPNIWPLAGPNIAKKGWPLQTLARVERQTHFGTFDFWVKPILKPFMFGNAHFWRLKAPKMHISSRMGCGQFFLHFFTFFSRIIWIFRVSREAALAADLITA